MLPYTPTSEAEENDNVTCFEYNEMEDRRDGCGIRNETDAEISAVKQKKNRERNFIAVRNLMNLLSYDKDSVDLEYLRHQIQFGVRQGSVLPDGAEKRFVVKTSVSVKSCVKRRDSR